MRVSVLGDVQVICSGVFVGFTLFDSRDWVYVISLVSVLCIGGRLIKMFAPSAPPAYRIIFFGRCFFVYFAVDVLLGVVSLLNRGRVLRVLHLNHIALLF